MAAVNSTGLPDEVGGAQARRPLAASASGPVPAVQALHRFPEACCVATARRLGVPCVPQQLPSWQRHATLTSSTPRAQQPNALLASMLTGSAWRPTRLTHCRRRRLQVGPTGLPLLDGLLTVGSSAGLNAGSLLLYASAATGAYAIWEQLRFRMARCGAAAGLLGVGPCASRQRPACNPAVRAPASACCMRCRIAPG